MPRPTPLWLAAFALAVPVLAAPPEAATITVAANAPEKPISPDLFGIFFEDLSYAADGGLYAELVQNRSFEYQATEQPTWNALTGWEYIQRGGGVGNLYVDGSFPLHANNPHCALLFVRTVGEGVGLVNSGFDGIPVTAGESYEFSTFARLLSTGGGRDYSANGKMPLLVRLESKDGTLLGEASVEATSPADWRRLSTTITATKSDIDARLVILSKTLGSVALDEVSLFPSKTFKGRKNGLRADLAQTIADLKPRFVRFPGGCLVHGDGVNNFYDWKATVGPIEQRKGQMNIWRYHQSVGLGYFEYFQFCEDIGAQPLPIVPAGVSCQNSSRTRETGQQCLPLADMPAYIQDVLDLIEWANGPATSKWGAVRAAAGHPKPFGLKYLGVGNEDKITPGFEERFKMILDALHAKHPEIVVVGTAGPRPDGEDFELGWKVATALHVPLIDEHYYQSPQWFWDNLHRYDQYDRAKPHVYVGEYAAHDNGRRSTLRAAIAEAAYLTSLERNGDVVTFASYAPLLANRRHTNWRPDLIYFDSTGVFPSLSYTVQQLYSAHRGDSYVTTTVSDATQLAAATVRDSHTGDLIVKIVNGASTARPLHLALSGVKDARPATKIVFGGADADAVNTDRQAAIVQPQTEATTVSAAFDYEAPANSLTIFRVPAK